MDNLRMNIDGTYTININVVDLDNIVQQRLVEAARIIEEVGTVEDIPIWDALMVIIPYFSSLDQKADLENWNTNPSWVEIVHRYG